MTAIGSVFLGDNQRFRMLASSTSPPSSPPPLGSPVSQSMSSVFPGMISPTHSPRQSIVITKAPLSAPSAIDPALSLELRLRWLEAILLGVHTKERKGKEKAPELKQGETLIRIAEDAQKRLDAVVENNDGLKRFIDHYDQHAQYLTPAFALSGSLPAQASSYENMSSSELEAFLTEMEPDIRAAEREMREIELLEKKGATAPGRLLDCEKLSPRLDAVMKAHAENTQLAALLEKRIAALMEKHATHVDALSELFVSWDDTITEAEDKVAKMERDREERKRMGYE